MRVLHVYSGNRFGGVEVLLLRLQELHHLCPALEPSFSLCFEGILSEKLVKSGGDVSILGDASFRKPWSIWKARRRLKRHLSLARPNLVVCHDVWIYALAAAAVRESGISLVLWHHTSPSGHWLKRSVRKTAPDGVIACSDFLASDLGKFGYRNGIVKVLHAPIVPPSKQHQKQRDKIRQELATPLDECVVLHVGRLSAGKGQRNLIEAFASINDLPVRLWIAGGPQDSGEKRFLQDLKSICAKLGISDRVSFLGHRDNVYDLYFAADIYCQPNQSPEAYGFSFVEALYAGLPVLSTDIGGASEILRDSESGEQFGILVPANDRNALISNLRRLIMEPVLRKAFEVKGPSRASRLADPRVALNRLVSIFEELVRG